MCHNSVENSGRVTVNSVGKSIFRKVKELLLLKSSHIGIFCLHVDLATWDNHLLPCLTPPFATSEIAKYQQFPWNCLVQVSVVHQVEVIHFIIQSILEDSPGSMITILLSLQKYSHIFSTAVSFSFLHPAQRGHFAPLFFYFKISKIVFYDINNKESQGISFCMNTVSD